MNPYQLPVIVHLRGVITGTQYEGEAFQMVIATHTVGWDEGAKTVTISVPAPNKPNGFEDRDYGPLNFLRVTNLNGNLLIDWVEEKTTLNA